MDPVEQQVKPVEVELGRNLQTYLQRLGLLPKKMPAFGLSAIGKVEPCPKILYGKSGKVVLSSLRNKLVNLIYCTCNICLFTVLDCSIFASSTFLLQLMLPVLLFIYFPVV